MQFLLIHFSFYACHSHTLIGCISFLHVHTLLLVNIPSLIGHPHPKEYYLPIMGSLNGEGQQMVSILVCMRCDITSYHLRIELE